MKYSIHYGNSAAAFPTQVLEFADRASATDLKVFISLCSINGNADAKKLAKLAGCTEDEARESLSFWRGTGLIIPLESGSDAFDIRTSAPTADSEDGVKPCEKALQEKKIEQKTKKTRGSEELPHYTSDQLSDILESRQDTAMLIDECQNIMGKIFNVKEINILIGFLDYLALDYEYIMMLLTYCASIGKKTLHYAETLAFSLYDAGITTGVQLSEELKRRENAMASEGRIRAMFGIGSRAFTSKEKKFISSWVNDMGYSIEIIERAYEVTADATGKGSFAYANAILERWNSEGLRTLEDIESSDQKKNDVPKEGSFDTDSFFEAAVRRSLGEDV